MLAATKCGGSPSAPRRPRWSAPRAAKRPRETRSHPSPSRSLSLSPSSCLASGCASKKTTDAPKPIIPPDPVLLCTRGLATLDSGMGDGAPRSPAPASGTADAIGAGEGSGAASSGRSTWPPPGILAAAKPLLARAAAALQPGPSGPPDPTSNRVADVALQEPPRADRRWKHECRTFTAFLWVDWARKGGPARCFIRS